MSFDIYRAQVRAEGWSFWQQRNLNAQRLNDVEARDLTTDLRSDAVDLYFKGALSASEAINSVAKKHYSWATVKLYYAVFYFLRSTLAAKQIALLRHLRSFVYVKGFSGEAFCAAGSNTTHDSVLRVTNAVFSRVDLLLSNSIESENPYIWLKEKRERINYKERYFHEPDVVDFWQAIDQTRDLEALINMYLNDVRLVYCFQEDHACLALPLKRWSLTKNDLVSVGISPVLSEKQIKALGSFFRINGNARLFSLLPDYDSSCV